MGVEWVCSTHNFLAKFPRHYFFLGWNKGHNGSTLGPLTRTRIPLGWTKTGTYFGDNNPRPGHKSLWAGDLLGQPLGCPSKVNPSANTSLCHKGLVDKAAQNSNQRDRQAKISLGQKCMWSRNPRTGIMPDRGTDENTWAHHPMQ